MDLSPGDRFGGYRILDALGRGGMAVVYVVEHELLHTRHALKILNTTDGSVVKRFLREGRVQARLQHPNVVTVTDVIQHRGAVGLLMECVQGPTLQGWLAENRPDLGLTEQIFRGIVAGVQRAHQEGIVHRDLKPANVLMATREDGALVPKVVDFGIAKACEDTEGTLQTRTDRPMGTPHYMSPEQIQDPSSVDLRTDIFALGCILYELVTGERTFEGRSAYTVYNNVVEGRYTPVIEKVPDLPAAFADTIAGCLAIERNRRFADCEAVLASLDVEPASLASGQYEVFISYSSMNRARAMDLYHRLQIRGVPIWLDQTSIPGGSEWKGQIVAAIETCKVMILLLSDASVASPHVRKEVGLALSNDKGVLPLLLQHEVALSPALQYDLQGIHRLPWSEGSTEQFEAVVAALVDNGVSLTAKPRPQERSTLVPTTGGTEDEPEAASPPAPRHRPVRLGLVVAVLAVGLVVAILQPWKRGAHRPTQSQQPSVELVDFLEPEDLPTTEPEPEPEPEPAPQVVEAPISAPAPPREPAPSAHEPPPAKKNVPPPSEPATLPTATVAFEGADALWLEGSGGRLEPGAVPPGDYTLVARFGDAAPHPAGSIRLVAGDRVQVTCDSVFATCEVAR